MFVEREHNHYCIFFVVFDMHPCKIMSYAKQGLFRFRMTIKHLHMYMLNLIWKFHTWSVAYFCVWKVKKVNHFCSFVLNDCQNVVKVTACYRRKRFKSERRIELPEGISIS